MDYFTKKLIFRVYLCWGDSKCISILQNKHPKALVLALIWKDPNTVCTRKRKFDKVEIDKTKNRSICTLPWSRIRQKNEKTYSGTLLSLIFKYRT